MEQTVHVFHYVVGVLILLSALIVATHKNPVVNALSLMSTLFLSALLFFAQESYFMGAVQVLVYAGAIAVLFVFIVMLLDLSQLSLDEKTNKKLPHLCSSILVGSVAFSSFALVLKVVFFSSSTHLSLEPLTLEALNAKSISAHLVTTHMLSFQAAGLLMLAAIFGVVLWARPTLSKYLNKGARKEAQ